MALLAGFTFTALVLAACDAAESGPEVQPPPPSPPRVCGAIEEAQNIPTIKLERNQQIRYDLNLRFSHTLDYTLFYTVTNPHTEIEVTVDNDFENVPMYIQSGPFLGLFPVDVVVDDFCEDSENLALVIQIQVVEDLP
ncbi:MAG: hypothetical protein AAGG50_14650 [Bacteroidota bacterium]